MAESLGVIIAAEESPSTSEFSFVAKEQDVKKGQYVQLGHGHGTMFGFISEVFKSNRYFERAESVADFEKSAGIPSQFPSDSWEYVIGVVKILGVFNNGRFERAFSPPSPGAAVRLADNAMLRTFLGFEDHGLHLGSIEHHDVPATVSMTRLLQKHFAILAMSGAGKCVTYGTPVMLSDGASKKIGELAGDAFDKGAVHKEDGVEVVFPKKTISILSLDDRYRLTPNPVYAITRRPSPENLLALRTRTGRQMTLTSEHPLLVMAGKGPEWKNAGELNAGEHVAVPRELSFGTNNEVNLIDFYLDSEKMRVFDKKALLELKMAIAEKKLWVSHDIHCQLSEGCMPIRVFHNLCAKVGRRALFHKAEKIRYFSSQASIPAKFKLDKNLGRFVGYLMGDGHVGKNCLNLSALNPEIREDFRKISMELFGFEASMYPTSVRLYSKALVCVMNDIFGVKPSSGEKLVSPTILSANKEFISGFLTGLFDTDGSVSLKKPEIEFCSKSRNLANGTVLLLLKFGILSMLKLKHNKTYNRDYHVVYVRGQSNLGIFLREIPFVSYKKSSRLKGVAALKSNTNIDVIPSLSPLLSSLMCTLRISESEIARRAGVSNNLSRYGCGADALSKQTFGNIARALYERAEELRYHCVAADAIILPSSKADAILSSCGEIKNSHNLQYKQISGCCGISATTVKRMLSGKTAITDSILEMGRGVSIVADHRGVGLLAGMLDEYESFAALDTVQLFKLAEGLNLPYELLDWHSGLHKGAWASFKRGSRSISTESKIRMVRGLQLAASGIKKEILSCRNSLNLLLSMADSAILWDRVEEITTVKSKHDYVYDLALEGNHNFLAGELPLVIHNSHFASVLLEELLSRKKEDGRVAVVVVDIHGEYLGFLHDPVFGQKTSLVDGSDICVPLKKVSPETMMEWVPTLSVPQRDVLRNALSTLRSEKKDSAGYGFKELIETIDKADVSKEDVRRALKRSISELKRYHFLSPKAENPKLATDIRPGHLLILDFSSIDSLRKKQILVSLLARRLFNLRKKGKVPPFLLLIEEAHNFAREKAEESDAVSRSIIETIAREGRKFGASLCLISQRPVNLSTTALSQCNTHVILRVTNPNDLDHIQMSSEGIDARVAKSITSLKVGEAIIVGAAVNHPIFVSVRDRKSTRREKGAPLHQQAIEFEQKLEKKEKNVEAFL